MEVRLIAHTACSSDMARVMPEVGLVVDWEATHPEVLVEFAGRNCYQSWSNPGKKTNKEYIENILKHGHGSVLEHASATFFITGVSRSLTHELIRHRHLSFSELSQRFVNMEEVEFIIPPALKEVAPGTVLNSKPAVDGYNAIVELLEGEGCTRKQAREAARMMLPNCTETKVVVTGNFRAWRGFIDSRANEHADAEICALAVEICTQLKARFPAAFQDYTIEGGYAWTHNRKV